MRAQPGRAVVPAAGRHRRRVERIHHRTGISPKRDVYRRLLRRSGPNPEVRKLVERERRLSRRDTKSRRVNRTRPFVGQLDQQLISQRLERSHVKPLALLVPADAQACVVDHDNHPLTSYARIC